MEHSNELHTPNLSKLSMSFGRILTTVFYVMHVKQDGRVRHTSPLISNWQQGEAKQCGHARSCFLLFQYFRRSSEAGDNFPVTGTCICFRSSPKTYLPPDKKHIQHIGKKHLHSLIWETFWVEVYNLFSCVLESLEWNPPTPKRDILQLC